MKGKWVKKYHGIPPEDNIVCSVCGYDTDLVITGLVRGNYTYKRYKPNFCPNCGADMREEKNNG